MSAYHIHTFTRTRLYSTSASSLSYVEGPQSLLKQRARYLGSDVYGSNYTEYNARFSRWSLLPCFYIGRVSSFPEPRSL
jgi:hypothetical protein